LGVFFPENKPTLNLHSHLVEKKAIIICKLDAGDNAHAGLLQKYYDKQRALNQLGWSTSLCCLRDKKPVVYHVKNVQSDPECHKLHQKYFFHAALECLTHVPSCDILYIRYPFSSPFLIQFLKEVKRKYPDIKIVIEFPTYPYKQEFFGSKVLKYFVNHYFADYLHKYADLAATTAHVESVYGIPACTFSHGLPLCSEIITRIGGKQPDLQLLAAGSLYDWFGLDRVIKGMSDELNFSGHLDVYLHIAGAGPAENSLKKSVKNFGLERFVSFYGALGKKELKALAARSDLGVGVLGSHRKNLRQHKPLKHRSYLTYHLPFILSTTDPDFPAHLPFVHYIPEDDTPLKIEGIKLFFKKSKDAMHAMETHIQQFTGWQQEMKKIIDKLQLIRQA